MTAIAVMIEIAEVAREFHEAETVETAGARGAGIAARVLDMDGRRPGMAGLRPGMSGQVPATRAATFRGPREGTTFVLLNHVKSLRVLMWSSQLGCVWGPWPT